MAVLELRIELRIDGEVVRNLGFPLIYRQTVDELQQFDYTEANDGADTIFSAVPVQEVDSTQFLFVKAVDKAVGVRVQGGESGNEALRLSAGGFLLIGNCTITDTNITVNNNSGAEARLQGLGGGT